MLLGFQYPSDEISIPEESFKFQVKLRSVKCGSSFFEMIWNADDLFWSQLDGSGWVVSYWQPFAINGDILTF